MALSRRRFLAATALGPVVPLPRRRRDGPAPRPPEGLPPLTTSELCPSGALDQAGVQGADGGVHLLGLDDEGDSAR